MKVKIKKVHPFAEIPKYATEHSAGMDLTVVNWEIDKYGNKVYHTGLAFEIPEGYVGLIFPRSSNAKKSLILSNSVGVIDSDYRGEVTLKYKASIRAITTMMGTNVEISEGESIPKAPFNVTNVWSDDDYRIGDRCGQIIIMPYPQIEFEEVEELSKTDRAEGGYGSTGK